MEKNLESCLEEVQSHEDVTGCLLADKLGLCLTASGNAKPEYTGIIAALAKQVSKLEPSAPHPVILLENDTRQCLIQQSGNLTAAIFKTTQSS
ncbi:hypothetical protein LSTR_LSTR002175 [Laodelphax striatellus]|uniref:Late endosomal/lysosomal adaptor and MAPK and MTOR activator 5 n=1 Tax=Laodelphax striatellus TaxID=195883 RepID=A0A482XRN3_LAOST|nr:hypothetical protein LSTR_LSTR002175 [Laodelphax striatellus]